MDAAIEAEFRSWPEDKTERQARFHVLGKLARTVAGFAIIIVGVAGLALPGPGWLVIVVGLSLLPFAWAQRTVKLIRRNIPGIPEEGGIPVSSWIAMGVLVVGFMTVSILWGPDIKDWAFGLDWWAWAAFLSALAVAIGGWLVLVRRGARKRATAEAASNEPA